MTTETPADRKSVIWTFQHRTWSPDDGTSWVFLNHENERVHYRKLEREAKNLVPGARYRLDIKADNSSSFFPATMRYLDREGGTQDEISQWQLRDSAAKTASRVQSVARTQGAAIDGMLAPIIAAMRGTNHETRRAMLALIIERLERGIWNA